MVSGCVTLTLKQWKFKEIIFKQNTQVLLTYVVLDDNNQNTVSKRKHLNCKLRDRHNIKLTSKFRSNFL